MATNLFVVANVKQLRTDSSFRILLHFSEHLVLLASQIQQFLTVFKIGLSLARFCRAFRNFGGGGGCWNPQTPPSVRHWTEVFWVFWRSFLVTSFSLSSQIPYKLFTKRLVGTGMRTETKKETNLSYLLSALNYSHPWRPFWLRYSRTSKMKG